MALVSLSEILTYVGKAASITEGELGRLNLLWRMVERRVKRRIGYEAEQAAYTEFYPDLRPQPGFDDFVDGGGWDVLGGRAVLSGRGDQYHQVLALKQLPVRSITSVHEDTGARGGQAPGAFPAASLLTAGEHYWLDVDATGVSRTGFLYRTAGRWSAVPRSIKVTYVGGFTRDELDFGEAADLKLAVLQSVAKSWNESRAQSPVASGAATGGGVGGIVMEKLEDYTVEYDAAVSRETTGLVVVLPQSAEKLLEPFVRMGAYF